MLEVYWFLSRSQMSRSSVHVTVVFLSWLPSEYLLILWLAYSVVWDYFALLELTPASDPHLLVTNIVQHNFLYSGNCIWISAFNRNERHTPRVWLRNGFLAPRCSVSCLPRVGGDCNVSQQDWCLGTCVLLPWKCSVIFRYPHSFLKR